MMHKVKVLDNYNPGAIVMGFFMDGEDAQMPIVIGVLRVKKAEKSEKHTFVFTGKEIDSPVVNPAIRRTSDTNSNENTNIQLKKEIHRLQYQEVT